MTEQLASQEALSATDIWVYAGQVTMPGYERLCSYIEREKSAETALLVLSTPGGDPHAGFRIARSLQHYYQNFDVLVPRYCKSAGTLICIGAGNLYLANQSELGPLDIQIKKSDELVGRNSGLDLIQALHYLQNQALTAFKTYVNDLTKNEGLSTKVASDISSRLTSGLLSPIFGQIDPVKLAEMQRATEIAFAYGARLNAKSELLHPDGLARLVIQYPSHGFIIDRKEARDIFSRVYTPEGALKKLSEQLDVATRAHINNLQPTIYKHSFEVSNVQDQQPVAAGSEPGSTGGFAESGESRRIPAKSKKRVGAEDQPAPDDASSPE